jgi:hypothetical protein
MGVDTYLGAFTMGVTNMTTTINPNLRATPGPPGRKMM